MTSYIKSMNGTGEGARSLIGLLTTRALSLLDVRFIAILRSGVLLHKIVRRIQSNYDNVSKFCSVALELQIKRCWNGSRLRVLPLPLEVSYESEKSLGSNVWRQIQKTEIIKLKSYEDQISMILRQLNAATAEQCLQQREEGTYLLVVVVVGGGDGMMLRTKSASCYAVGSYGARRACV